MKLKQLVLSTGDDRLDVCMSTKQLMAMGAENEDDAELFYPVPSHDKSVAGRRSNDAITAKDYYTGRCDPEAPLETSDPDAQVTFSPFPPLDSLSSSTTLVSSRERVNCIRIMQFGTQVHGGVCICRRSTRRVPSWVSICIERLEPNGIWPQGPTRPTRYFRERALPSQPLVWMTRPPWSSRLSLGW